MRISRLLIENFRSIRSLDVDFGDTTVFVGPNNAGKSAIVDAIRLVLSPNTEQNDVGFSENDVHQTSMLGHASKYPPIRITIQLEEGTLKDWPDDLLTKLGEIIKVTSDGRNALKLQATYVWNDETGKFKSTRQFLDKEGQVIRENTPGLWSSFLHSVTLFWLGSLRDAADEFKPSKGCWGNLLRPVHIPPELESEVLQSLREMDSRIIKANPIISSIAETIGQATSVAIDEGAGLARISTTPLNIHEMIQKSEVVLRNEPSQPLLPLSEHGQGLQSLAVIFLFQAAVHQYLSDSESAVNYAVFAIEEPEAHLHPQAARTLWDRVSRLPGQRILTTHSPYFLHKVPLRDVRIVRLKQGCTSIDSLPKHVDTDLPWNDSVSQLCETNKLDSVFQSQTTGRLAARSWFDKSVSNRLVECYRNNEQADNVSRLVERLRYDARLLISRKDETDLSIHGRRIRGDIFFAHEWILVEGVTEYLLIQAIAFALNFPLDTYGVSVIDFQNGGSPGIYVALAEALGISWQMIVDGDKAGRDYIPQITNRGFRECEIKKNISTLTEGCNLEQELVQQSGHGKLLKEIICNIHSSEAKDWSDSELLRYLNSKKTKYMQEL
ncbi:MAG: AAA family ATPase [Gammaproteobacteria bacterium]|nr:AAA family ATPase [Gammaproteobacteria bacterium]